MVSNDKFVGDPARRRIGPSEFQRLTNVSRETLDRLAQYQILLEKWQDTINLVSRSSLPDIWGRHFLDSAQLWPLVPRLGNMVDIGSGAGFPGLVIAILGRSGITLVEADERRCAFLFEVARRTETDVSIVCDRAEALPSGEHPACITARAVAGVPKLLGLCAHFIHSSTVCVFPKGQRAVQELTEATKSWIMRSAAYPSLTDRQGTILRLTEVQRATI